MTMHASIHGRCVFEPRQRETKTGKPMTRARLAVDVTGRDADDETLWLDLLAFGQQADDLARVAKGESVSAIGRITRGRYTASNGESRESLTMIPDAVMTVRSARPGQRRKRADASDASHRASSQMQAPEFDDPIGF
jgi:single-strand DNA-binding protein